MNQYKKMLLAAATALFVSAPAVAETLRIGTEGAYPPFNQIDASGEVVGFDLDIAKALCAEMQVECTVVTSDWDGIIPALNNNKFDFLVASMSITDERKQAVDFTEPYYTNKLQFVAPKDAEFQTDEAIWTARPSVHSARPSPVSGWKTTWVMSSIFVCTTPRKTPIWT